MTQLSEAESNLLLALRRGKHFKANPAKPADLLSLAAEDANPVGRSLIKLGLASRVVDDGKPGATFLRITDAGISEADKLIEARRKPTLWQLVKQIPFGKRAWELFLVVLGAVLGAFITTLLQNNACAIPV